ncbi:2-nitropropane dioxygenase [Moniliophthora roreri]|nr:2-nitropropane dioxygenase [Moniliophthora roreri]
MFITLPPALWSFSTTFHSASPPVMNLATTRTQVQAVYESYYDPNVSYINLCQQMQQVATTRLCDARNRTGTNDPDSKGWCDESMIVI